MQIDVTNLTYLDLTNSNVLNTQCLAPSGHLDADVVSFARSWSKILIDCYYSFISSENIVSTFEVLIQLNSICNECGK